VRKRFFVMPITNSLTPQRLKNWNGIVHFEGAIAVAEYKGHRIEVSPVGKGWRAAIFAPGSTRAIADSPSNLEKSRSEEIVAEAKRVIDTRLHDR
jgi:hypothetical protein